MKPTSQIEQLIINLADLDSVQQFATEFKAKNLPCHFLVLNAGIFTSSLNKSKQGYEMTFATNHLGHFALVLALHDVLVASQPARVVHVSSELHYSGDPAFIDDFNYEKKSFGTGTQGMYLKLALLTM